MTPKIMGKYNKLLQQKTWTELNIRSFKAMLRREQGYIQGGNANLGGGFLKKFRKHAPYLITQEQSEKGLEWIKNKCFKKNGKPREGISIPFEPWECESIKVILEDFSHWTLDDFLNVSYNNYPSYQPQYTLHANSGLNFSYTVDGQGMIRD